MSVKLPDNIWWNFHSNLALWQVLDLRVNMASIFHATIYIFLVQKTISNWVIVVKPRSAHHAFRNTDEELYFCVSDNYRRQQNILEWEVLSYTHLDSEQPLLKSFNMDTNLKSHRQNWNNACRSFPINKLSVKFLFLQTCLFQYTTPPLPHESDRMCDSRLLVWNHFPP